MQETAHAVAGTQRLFRNELIAGDHRVGVASEVEYDVPAVQPLYESGYELAHPVLVRLDNLGALRFAHLLHDDLLGGLGGDASE